jgi:mutator protein MutT
MSIFYVAAHALILDVENRVLVTRRPADDNYMPLHWDIPGGTVEAGEKVEEALVREVLEETKLTVMPLQPIFVYSNLSQLPKRQTIQIVYSCALLRGQIVLQPEEHDDYRWVGLNELAALNCIAFLRSLIDSNTLDFIAAGK